MQRVRLLAGNWKMHKLNKDLAGFFHTFSEHIGSEFRFLEQVPAEILFAPPCTLLAEMVRIASPLGFKVAAQNVHWESQGAYTGEISAEMLQEVGVTAAIIGHSERRQFFGETDQFINLKLKAAIAAGLMPILCIGETLKEREEHQTEKVIKTQLELALDSVTASKSLVIAYEPVWAIGTGRSATAEMAQEVHLMIRHFLEKRFGTTSASSTRILYGGSANPQNIKSLMAQPDIDGALVGGASLKPQDFAQMVKLGFAS